jgi:hypothetical protein
MMLSGPSVHLDPALAEPMKLACVWHTPLGLPVVPEVYRMTDTSSGLVAFHLASHTPGWSRSHSAPSAFSFSVLIRPGWS